MNKMLAVLLLLIFFVLFAGCNVLTGQVNLNKSKAASIKLDCTELCKTRGIPFATKRFTEQKDIEVFVRAINKAEKIQGEIDYAALFHMKVNYKDGSVTTYHLNIDNRSGSRGLLVETSNTNQGYSIPNEVTEELYNLIVGEIL
ncbi:hypothetical protein [Paenibacillus gansuensis]|uniref:YhfM-like domain-containing protein n=1 Tax=Paenibacillus gansuensis TaxID=306542 RepID=A0ABW5PKV3_9BACL